MLHEVYPNRHSAVVLKQCEDELAQQMIQQFHHQTLLFLLVLVDWPFNYCISSADYGAVSMKNRWIIRYFES